MATSSLLPSSTSSSYVPVVQSTFPQIPLTTTFIPPSQCAGYYSTVPVYITTDRKDASLVLVGDGKTCLPSGFAPEATNYFSPGLVCPSSYYSACQDNHGVSSITTVTCCPSQGNVALSCVQPSSLHAQWEYLFCTWQASETTSIFVTVVDHGTTSTVSQSVFSPLGVNAYGVRMVYQSTDLATTRAQTSSASQTSSSASSPSPTGTSNTSSLSLGAKIAIGVVVPVVAIGLAVLGFFLWRKRASHRGRDSSQATHGQYRDISDPPKHEVGGIPLNEVGGKELPAELSAPTQDKSWRTRAELPIDR